MTRWSPTLCEVEDLSGFADHTPKAVTNMGFCFRFYPSVFAIR
jgi:hypothetical protein